jgi:hypothetical protein
MDETDLRLLLIIPRVIVNEKLTKLVFFKLKHKNGIKKIFRNMLRKS